MRSISSPRIRRPIAIAVAVSTAAVFAAAGSSALAFPDGAPWEVAGGEGCAQCHFDAPPEEGSAALEIVGLPTDPASGARYPLTIRLADDRMVTAGFLLSAWQDAARALEAGEFVADGAAADSAVETNGARARSTEDGLRPASAGVAAWTVVWQAPERIDAPIELELWANAGNDDKSPFGDATHLRVFRLDGRDGQAGVDIPNPSGSTQARGTSNATGKADSGDEPDED